jgi:hypothetical protein
MQDEVANSFRIALETAEAALTRAGKHRTEESRRSLIEAIWWIAAGDDYLRTAYGNKWTKGPSRKTNTDLLDGVFWARSRAFHDPLSLTTLERVGGFSSAFSAGFDVAWRWNDWRDVEKISDARGEPDPRVIARQGAYERGLSGKVVHDTLRDAIDVLRSVDIEALGSPQ